MKHDIDLVLIALTQIIGPCAIWPHLPSASMEQFHGGCPEVEQEQNLTSVCAERMWNSLLHLSAVRRKEALTTKGNEQGLKSLPAEVNELQR